MIARSQAVPDYSQNYIVCTLHMVLKDPISADALLMGQVSHDVLVKLTADPHSLDNFL
jgi:hypothetical protein